jgi:hypothetical protein
MASAMSRRILFTLLFALAGACARDDKMSSADSAELARDLALANQPAADPTFQDTALVTDPVVQQSRSTPRAARRVAAGPPRLDSTPLRVQRPVPAPEPESAPASRFKGFGSGTSFALQTKSQVCTTNLPGDKIVATLTEPVTGENGAYLPAGTTVVLEVASVTPASGDDAAQISLRVRSIDINEQPTPVEASVAVTSALERREVPRNSNSDRKKVVGGAIAGAVIGQIMGRDTKSTVIGAAVGGAAGAAAAAASRKYDACLPAGGSVRVTTTQQIALSA